MGNHKKLEEIQDVENFRGILGSGGWGGCAGGWGTFTSWNVGNFQDLEGEEFSGAVGLGYLGEGAGYREFSGSRGCEIC